MSLSTEIGRCNAGIHCSTLMRLENGYNSNDFKVNRVANSEPQTSTHTERGSLISLIFVQLSNVQTTKSNIMMVAFERRWNVCIEQLLSRPISARWKIEN